MPTVFVRLTGCPLRCAYCDTSYAFKGGSTLTVDEICKQVAQYAISHVTVTGGEPLAQKGTLELLFQLCEQGHQVSLETAGAHDVSRVDRRVTLVMDIKTPGSGEMERNRWQNLQHLKPGDQIKFVIGDRADYEWACSQVEEHDLGRQGEVLFSPVWGWLPPATLAEWILEDRLAVRFQLQLHKVLWGEEPGR
jgi:7-carboxy-7-deazaguanine synthase